MTTTTTTRETFVARSPVTADRRDWRRTDHATYVYTAGVMNDGTEYQRCIAWTRHTAEGDWELRQIPTRGHHGRYPDRTQAEAALDTLTAGAS